MPEPTRRLCPGCQQYFVDPGQRAHCSAACRIADWRRNHPDRRTQPPLPLPADVYECPDCNRRYLWHSPTLPAAAPNCPHCAVTCHRVGVGGRCPSCNQPVAANELLDNQEVTATTKQTR